MHDVKVQAYLFLVVTWIIKIQRQIFGFNLKIRKAKWTAPGFYLYLRPKWAILPPRILRLRLSWRAVSSHFIFFSSAGIKGEHHHCPASMGNYCG